MEEFDIDAQINKIKAQMGDLDASMFRDEAPLPNDEPDLPVDVADEVQIEQPQTVAEPQVETPQIEPQKEISEQSQVEHAIEEFKEENQPHNYDTEIYPENRFYEPEDENYNDPFEQIEENSAVKKYVVYVSKEFVSDIDDLDADARSAYVNEALQIKKDFETTENKVYLYLKLFKHALVCFLTLVIAVPALFWLANKSIIATKENYRYVQNSFEKLYQERLDRQHTIKVLPKKKY